MPTTSATVASVGGGGGGGRTSPDDPVERGVGPGVDRDTLSLEPVAEALL